MTNEPTRDARRAQIAEGVKAGKTVKEIAEELQVSRITLWRDLKALQEQAVLTLDTEGLKAIKAQQYAVQLKMEEALLQGVLDPATVTAWNKVREPIAKLLGLNAESRSVVAHVSSSVTNELAASFLRAVTGLDETIVRQEIERLAALPRKVVDSEPPTRKELPCDTSTS